MGLSRVTVRKAFAILEEDGLIVRKKKMGTFVREGVLDSKALHVAVLIPGRALDRGSFHGEIFGGCLSRALESGARLHCFPVSAPSVTLREIADCGASAVMVVAPKKGQMEILDALNESDLPTLVVNREVRGNRLSFVSTDHARGGEEMTRHFIAEGHERIAFVGRDDDDLCVRDRYEGYVAAFAKTGAILDEKLTFSMNLEEAKARPNEEIDRFFGFMTDTKPTALVSAGTGVMRDTVTPVVRAMETVPEMATFDEIWDTNPFKATLHEVVQPSRSEIGYTAMFHLERLARGNVGRVGVLMPPTILLKERGNNTR